MRFVLQGKVKPYVRMTRRGKYVSRQAQEYLTSKSKLGWQMMDAANGIVYPDDRWIDEIVAKRARGDAYRTVLEIATL